MDWLFPPPHPFMSLSMDTGLHALQEQNRSDMFLSSCWSFFQDDFSWTIIRIQHQETMFVHHKLMMATFSHFARTCSCWQLYNWASPCSSSCSAMGAPSKQSNARSWWNCKGTPSKQSNARSWWNCKGAESKPPSCTIERMAEGNKGGSMAPSGHKRVQMRGRGC